MDRERAEATDDAEPATQPVVQVVEDSLIYFSDQYLAALSDTGFCNASASFYERMARSQERNREEDELRRMEAEEKRQRRKERDDRRQKWHGQIKLAWDQAKLQFGIDFAEKLFEGFSETGDRAKRQFNYELKQGMFKTDLEREARRKQLSWDVDTKRRSVWRSHGYTFKLKRWMSLAEGRYWDHVYQKKREDNLAAQQKAEEGGASGEAVVQEPHNQA